MTWNKLLTEKRLDPHTTSKEELDALRDAVSRNLGDASITSLSADGRFNLAYSAVLLLAKMAVACAGYRVKGHGAHYTTVSALELAMGAQVSNLTAYFNSCRQKRNKINYDQANVVTDTETNELLEKARRFQQLVEDWISHQHPQYA